MSIFHVRLARYAEDDTDVDAREMRGYSFTAVDADNVEEAIRLYEGEDVRVGEAYEVISSFKADRYNIEPAGSWTAVLA